MSSEGQAEQLLRLLWGAPEPGRRGPKPRMSVAQIVAAGITVADRDGLDAVSMQRVAAEVGRTTMSVYTYVPNKDILLDLMMDAAVGAVPELVGDTWRDRVEDWVGHVSRLFRRRPWVLLVSVHSPPMGPNQLAWFDSLIGAVADSGAEPVETFAVAQYLLGAVREWSRLHNAQVGRRETDYAEVLEKLADPERFPALSRLVADGGVTQADPLMLGLGRLLDGVEARLPGRDLSGDWNTFRIIGVHLSVPGERRYGRESVTMWIELITQVCPQATFAAGATDVDLDAVESRLGQFIPTELRDLLRETDGVRDRHGVDVVWSVDRILRDNEDFRGNESFAELYMPLGPLMFFGDLASGDQCAFVRQPERPDVFVWNHETDDRRWAADDLADYLTRCLSRSGVAV